jgi:uncharacterized protein YbjT (DUF2867 family)
MTKVLIIGANGRIARWAVDMLAEKGLHLTLFVRDASRLAGAPGTARIVEGDARDEEAVAGAVRGQDIVYANLAGEIDTKPSASSRRCRARGYNA